MLNAKLITRYSSIFLLLYLASCSTSLEYKKLQWTGESSSRVILKKDLDVKEDIKLLLYALDKGYIGSDYIPKEVYSIFEESLQKASGMAFKDNISFCKHLGQIFSSLPDGHFSIWYPGVTCYGVAKEKADVGLNYGENSSNPAYSMHKLDQGNISLVSIRKFYSYGDPHWKGFKKSIDKAKKSKSIIIDLRGNGGGDSSRGLQLARSVLNSSIQHNRKKIIRKNTPESWTLYRNNLYRDKIWGNHEKYPMHLEVDINVVDRKRSKSVDSDKEFIVRDFEAPTLENINYKGSIYVLIDRKCGSSCEHTLEALKFHPNVKSVGENTAGAIHYGQMGLLRLPSSGIYLMLATQYFELFDSGYYEKVGYTPDIVVPKGADALKYLLHNIKMND